jgi:DNA-binding CsgD family transcriptional regulator
MLEPGICRGILVLTEEGTTLAIHVVPIASANNWVTLVFLVLPRRCSSPMMTDSTASPPLDAFAARYELTRIEARVLAEILIGEGRRRVSERPEIGATTVRSHLQKVFLKTGTSKQAELVRLFFAQTVPISQFRVR